MKLLVDMGGKGYVTNVLERLPAQVKLTPGDFETLKSGAVLWENRAQWARQNLVIQGLLQANSPRGVWEISAKGREFLAEGS